MPGKKYLLLLFACLLQLYNLQAIAQTNKIDVLKASFYTAPDTTQKLNAALAVCTQAHSLNIDTLYHYASIAEQLAVVAGNPQKKILANVAIETWLGKKTLYDSALKLCNADLPLINYARDPDVYTAVKMQQCNLMVRKNDHKAALEEAYHFLHEAEAKEDTISQIFCKTIIGFVYKNLEQTDLALQWFNEAEQTGKEPALEEKKNEFRVFLLIGQMHNWRVQEDKLPADILKDSLLSDKYTNRAITDSRKYGNLTVLALSLGLKGANNSSDIDMLQKCIKESISIFSQFNDTLSMQNSLYLLCDSYNANRQPEKSIEEYEKNSSLFRKANSGQQIDYLDKLGKSYELKGDYKKATELLYTQMHYKDSLFKTNSEHELADLNAKYDDQKKENIIVKQQLDIAAKKNSVYAISILSGLLLLGLLFLYRYYYKKQKQQKEKEIIAIATAQEDERKRISSDLHDNIGVYAAAAASSISFIEPKDQHSEITLSLLKDNVRDMITQLNDSIWALNKKEVYLTGVSDRLKVFVQKLEYAYPLVSISVEEQIEKDRLLSPYHALHLFRIMQEALNNALKHSKCSKTVINIFSNEKQMQVTIKDDGNGIHGTTIYGNGINNLKERARESGWDAVWVNNTEGGVSVMITAGSA